MRPLSLTIEGFTAFRDRQTIDFEALDLFVITGPTGAGKTSILDAMVLALYGQVPRLGGKHGTTDLVSLGAPQARIQFEFMIEGRGRFRVARRLNRKSPQTATLERLDGETWVSACERSGVRECDRVLTELLGLDYDSFCKAVVLPQGEFHRFLKGDPAERRQVLVSLLGVSYFQRMAAIARERQSDLSSRIERTEEILRDRYASATPESVADAKKTARAAAKVATSLAAALRDAKAALREAQEHSQLGEALTAELADIKELGAAFRDRTEQCRVSEAAKTEADVRVKAATSTLSANRSHLAATEKKVSALERELGTAEDIALTLGAAETLASTTEEEVAAESQLAAAQTAETAAKRDVRQSAQAETKTDAVWKSGSAADSAAAEAHEDASVRVQELQLRTTEAQRAARDLKSAEDELAKAESRAAKDRATAEKQRQARDRAAAHLEEHRRANAVVALAHDLDAGDPCPVCGTPLASEVSVPGDTAAALRRATEEHEQARARAEASRDQAARADASVEAAKKHVATNHVQNAEALKGYGGLEELEADLRAAKARAEKAGTEQKQARAGLLEAQQARDEAHDRHLQAQGELSRHQGLREAAESSLKEIRKRKAAAAKTLDAYFLGQTPPDAEKQLLKRRTRLTTAAESLRTARSAVDESTRVAENAAGEVDTANQRLVALDLELTQLRTRTEGVAQTLTKLLAPGGAMPAPPARTGERAHIAEKLATWADKVATKAATGAAQASKQREEAEQQITTLASKHDLSAPTAERAVQLIETAERGARDGSTKAQSAVEEAERRARERTEMEENTKNEKEQIAVLSSLALELRGDRFGEYIVLETLAILADRASEELLRLSDGRYSLIPVEGDFEVVDHANADERRSVKTLSGGETFLASLALALALSRHVGELATEGLGVKLEAVFIDEGFGTLDPETLDEVIDALERLREDDLIVGVISHVPELAQRVRSGLEVRKEDGRSRIIKAAPA